MAVEDDKTNGTFSQEDHQVFYYCYSFLGQWLGKDAVQHILTLP